MDLHGRLIGIASRIKTKTDWSQQNCKVGFFTPSDKIIACLDCLKAGQDLKALPHAFLGVSPLEGTADTLGVTLEEVITGSSADQAKLRRGDVILALDGADTPSWVSLVRLLKTRKPGDNVQITYQRGTDVSVAQTVLKSREVR